MLWFKLLQNTIYCGKLHFTSYQIYAWGGYRQKSGDKRQKNINLVLCSSYQLSAASASLWNFLQQAVQKGEG